MYGSTYGTANWALPNYGQTTYDSAKAILTAGIPVIITEFGDQNATGTARAPFALNLLPWADTNQRRQLSAGCWMLDATSTPPNGYGVYVKQHYLRRAASYATCQRPPDRWPSGRS